MNDCIMNETIYELQFKISAHTWIFIGSSGARGVNGGLRVESDSEAFTEGINQFLDWFKTFPRNSTATTKRNPDLIKIHKAFVRE